MNKFRLAHTLEISTSLTTVARNILIVATLLLSMQHALADAGSAPPIPNLTSPENALKSYWATKDWYSTSHSPKTSAKKGVDHSVFLTRMAEVTAGETQKYFSTWTPSPQSVLSRTIKNKTEENPSRVIVVVNIKNITPIPAGAKPTDSELAVREAGQDYKYVIENQNGVWKISEVWRLGLPGIPYRAHQVYANPPIPYFPASVHED